MLATVGLSMARLSQFSQDIDGHGRLGVNHLKTGIADVGVQWLIDLRLPASIRRILVGEARLETGPIPL